MNAQTVKELRIAAYVHIHAGMIEVGQRLLKEAKAIERCQTMHNMRRLYVKQ